jgi:Ras-related protein Rab-11A
LNLYAVQTDEAKEFCKQNKLFFIETSALADSNVGTAFETILKEIYRLISRKTVSAGESGTNTSGFQPTGQSIVLTEANDPNSAPAQQDQKPAGLKCCA